MSGSPLAKLSRVDLAFLQKAIKRNQLPTPISEMALQSLGKGALFAKLGPISGAPKEAALALLAFALAPSSASGADQGVPASASLVWTGPEVNLSSARPTTAVLLEVLQAARKSVLIAGYQFDHGEVLFERLSAAVRDHGVKVSLFLDIPRASTKNTNLPSYLALKAHQFVAKNWPFGEPMPDMYYFPAGVKAGSHKSMHAKCVVVDGEMVVVGSANFTERGCQRNIEVGVCTKDSALAKTLTDQFMRLVEAGDFARLPSPAQQAAVVPEQVEEEESEEADTAEEHAGEVGGAPSGHPQALRQIFEEQLVPEFLWQFYADALERQLEAPEVGDDIESRGQVIGTAELFWDQPQVAILVAEQFACRPALEAAGWTCFASDEVYLRKEEIFNLLERTG